MSEQINWEDRHVEVVCENPEHEGPNTPFLRPIAYVMELRRRELAILCDSCEQRRNQSRARLRERPKDD